MQFCVAVRDFLSFCRVERRLSDHTLDAYAADLADFGRSISDPSDVAAVSEVELRSYLETMVGKRGLAAATVRRRLACLRCFYRYLERRGFEANPFHAWHPSLPRRRRLPRTLTRMEAASLVSSCLGAGLHERREMAFLKVAVPLMISTGVRVGELCHLTVDDLAPDCSSIRVHGKGSRDRIAYVSDQSLRRELVALATKRREEAPPPRWLFLNRRGGALRPQSVRAILRRHAAEAGLHRRITPHMLRHTAATLLIESGVDIRFVQRLLGHSSIATTEIYTHIADEPLRTTLARADVLGSLSTLT